MTKARDAIEAEDKLDVMVVWMSETPMVPGKSYLIKHTSRTVTGTINTLRYQINVNSLHSENAPALKLNEIGRCGISLNQAIQFDGYRRNRSSGAVIIMLPVPSRNWQDMNRV